MGSTNVEETTARTDKTNGTESEEVLAGNVATNGTKSEEKPAENVATEATDLEGALAGNVEGDDTNLEGAPTATEKAATDDTNSEGAPAAANVTNSEGAPAAYEAQIRQNERIKLESWGGGGGQKWETEKISASTQIKRIIIKSGDAIDSIEFIYKTDGEEKSSGVKGGPHGTPKEFFLNEGEEIVTIEGSYAQGWVNGPVMITWLKFIVGRTGRESPSFGTRRGKDFKITAANGKIVGFHGRAGSYVDAIGVYIEPKYRNTIDAERKSIKLSQWGGGDGVAWGGDKPIDPSTRVTKIIIRHGDFIDSFKYEYKVEGSETETEGGDGEGGEETAIVLHPCEYITGIRGSYGDLWDDPYHVNKPPKVIHRLTFYTNQSRRFGPFGLKRGKHFSFSAQDGKIVGFHGVSGKYLEGLGVYLAAANKKSHN